MVLDLISVDLSPLQTASEIGWRLDAPFHSRLVLQPLVAILLGLRDGRLDAMTGTPPYLYALIFSPADRQTWLRSGVASTAKSIAVAIIMDIVIQFTFLDSVSLLGALLIGGLVVGVPYCLARGLSNRLASRRAPVAGPPTPATEP